jgi:beta-glucosidase
MFRFGQFERPYAPGEIDAAAHGAIARRIGARMAVLLKNAPADDGEPLLPLAAASVRSIVIIGQDQFAAEACLGGGGSSKVLPLYTVPPLDRPSRRGRRPGADIESSRHRGAISPTSTRPRRRPPRPIMVGHSRQIATEVVPEPGSRTVRSAWSPGARRERAHDRGAQGHTPVMLPWIDAATAVWNQGTEDGHVVANLLFGLANPAARSPTYAAAERPALRRAANATRHRRGLSCGHPLVKAKIPVRSGPGHRAAVQLRLGSPPSRCRA